MEEEKWERSPLRPLIGSMQGRQAGTFLPPACCLWLYRGLPRKAGEKSPVPFGEAFNACSWAAEAFHGVEEKGWDIPPPQEVGSRGPVCQSAL